MRIISNSAEFPINFYPYLGLLCAGGIQMSGWRGHEINRQKSRIDPTLEVYEFFPYISHQVSE